MTADGVREEQDLRNAGFSDEEVNQWKSQTSEELYNAGFNQDEVKSYFGIKDPDMAPAKAIVKENLNKNLKETDGKMKQAGSYLEALEAGWDVSVTGLAINKPDVALAEDAPRAFKIISSIGTFAGDLPAMVAGEIGGNIVGASAGTAVAGPIGAAVGTVAGGGAGAFALPAAMRQVMMDYYEKGDIKSAGDFLDRLSAASYEALKGSVVGAATFGAGKFAGQGVAKVAAEVGTMTSVGAAVEGHLPNADDFVNAAIVIGGFHAAGLAGKKLRNVYAKDGMRPEEVTQNAGSDVTLKQKILSDNPNTPVDVSGLEKVKTKEVLLNGETREVEVQLPPKPEYKAPSTWADAYQAAIHDLNPVKRAVEFMAEGEPIKAGDNAYYLMRTYKDYQGKVARAYKYNTLDFKTGKANGEGLEPILKEVPNKEGQTLSASEQKVISSVDPESSAKKGDSWGKLTAYLLSKRAVELDGRNIKTGIDIESAKEVIKSSEKEYGPIAKRLQDFQKRMKDYAVDSGLLSKDAAKAMDEANQAYVPFYRLVEEADFQASGKKSSSLFKTIKGSENKILDPIESIHKNTAAIIRMAEKNRALTALVKNASTEKGELLFEKRSASSRPIEVKNEEIVKFLKGQGVDTNTADGFTIWRGMNSKLEDNEFAVVRDGKKEVWATRPDIAEAVRAMDYHPGTTNMWYKTFIKGPASLLRAGVTLSPDFMMRNFFRDQLTSTVQSKYGKIPFAETLSAIGNIWKKDQAWQEFLSSGGASGSFGQVSRYLETDMFELNKQTGIAERSWNVIKTPFDVLAATSEIIENIPRLAEFKRGGGVEGTFDQKISAAMSAREVTVDFARAGARVRAMNQIVPFFNVGLQGTDRMIREFKENPKRATAIATSMLTLPTMMLWWANKDDSRYKDAPSWEKDLYWIIPTDKWETAKSYADAMSRPEDLRRQNKDGSWEVNNGAVFRLPKPFEMGMLFASLPERALDAFYQKDPEKIKDFGKTIVGGLVPNVIPTFISPMAEQYANKSFFTGNEIVGSYAERFLPEYQYNEYTSDVAKQLGKMISYIPGLNDVGPKDAKLSSPLVVENYIKAWGGTTGQYIVKLADQGLKAAGISKPVEKPESKLADVPFVKAFIMRYPQANLQPMEEFRANFEETQKMVNTVNGLAKQGDVDAAMKLMNAHPENFIQLGGIKRAIQEQSRTIHKINANPDMSPSDKRQLIDSIYYQMNVLAKNGNKILKDYRENLGVANQKKEGEN